MPNPRVKECEISGWPSSTITPFRQSHLARQIVFLRHMQHSVFIWRIDAFLVICYCTRCSTTRKLICGGVVNLCGCCAVCFVGCVPCCAVLNGIVRCFDALCFVVLCFVFCGGIVFCLVFCGGGGVVFCVLLCFVVLFVLLCLFCFVVLCVLRWWWRSCFTSLSWYVDQNSAGTQGTQGSINHDRIHYHLM